MSNINENSEILKKNEVKLFFKYAIPNILSLVLISSAGIFDAAFIGKYVGENALAGVNIANPVFGFIWGLSMMVTTGAAVITGNYLGQKNIEKANIIFTKSLIAIFVLTVLIILLLNIFKYSFIRQIGGSDITAPIAITYLNYITPFIPFITVGYALSVYARVDNFPFISSFALIASALINIALDSLFIIVFDWGIKGAATATGISYLFVFIILAIHFSLKKGVLRLNFKKGSWKEIYSASYNGMSEFINETSIGVVVILFNVLMMKYAQESGVAAFSAINYIMWLGIMVAYAVADSLNPLISINYGAKEILRIKKILKIAIVFILTNGFFIFLTLTFFSEQLTLLFIKDTSSKAYPIAIELMDYVRWVFFINGINMILSVYFTATLKPVESVIIAMLRGLILPATLLTTLPYFLKELGIYISTPLAEIITLIVALSLFLITKNKILNSNINVNK